MDTKNQDPELQSQPRTNKELGDDIVTFFHNGGWYGEDGDYLLRQFCDAGKLDLAIELLKLKELEHISADIEEIRETLKGVDSDIDSLTQAVCSIASTM